MTTVHTIELTPLSAEAFAPYGAILEAEEDGTPVTAAEQGLDLSRGTPRFSLMRLRDKPARFTSLTRHRSVTQCLAAVGGGPWVLAVAAPTGEAQDDTRPTVDAIAAFRIPGDVAVLLHRGTWHAGPYFGPAEMSFFNLELTDTNVVDHQTHRVAEADAVCAIVDTRV